MTTTPLPPIKTLAPWVGSDRMNADRIGAEIGTQAMVSIPFCGGCSIVLHVDARQILLSDLHRHIITLAKTVSDEASLVGMMERLDKELVHPDCLRMANMVLASIESAALEPHVNIAWAAAYFTSVWLSRSCAGSDTELTAGLASRRTASGGSSVRRWRSAVEGLPAWREVLRDRCEFVRQDWQAFLSKTRDEAKQAIYIDPPWWDAKVRYKYGFTEQEHRILARRLHEFKNCRVVIRHSDHPLYRELYPDWTWVEIGGRNQGNKRISECLIINGPSYTSEESGLF